MAQLTPSLEKPQTQVMRVIGSRLYFLPVSTRVPYKFGAVTMSHVLCARVRLTVRGSDGRVATGWGETPLSVGWVWPGALPYAEREQALTDFCRRLTDAWADFEITGHPLEIGHAFIEGRLRELQREFNTERPAASALPWLAALVCCSPFDLALYDAFGRLVDRPVYETLGAEFLAQDLASYLEPAADAVGRVSFAGKYPADFLTSRQDALPAWHSVGGLDPLDESDLTGREPKDGYPVQLREWIARDGLRCLKVKLKGTDAEWDFARLIKIGRIGRELGVRWLCADYNCTARDVDYVTAMLDRLLNDAPETHAMLLYVEQPFAYELEEHAIAVHAISARKPLFMDESAHDWRIVRRGRELGWTNVALKTCKTQTVALLSLCWARAHGMTVMVQDLTNPMLAMIPHALLAAHAGTVMGLETNAPQYYPEASRPEAAVHPGLYELHEGKVDVSTVRGAGFGYRLEEMHRELPAPALICEE